MTRLDEPARSPAKHFEWTGDVEHLHVWEGDDDDVAARGPQGCGRYSHWRCSASHASASRSEPGSGKDNVPTFAAIGIKAHCPRPKAQGPKPNAYFLLMASVQIVISFCDIPPRGSRRASS